MPPSRLPWLAASPGPSPLVAPTPRPNPRARHLIRSAPLQTSASISRRRLLPSQPVTLQGMDAHFLCPPASWDAWDIFVVPSPQRSLHGMRFLGLITILGLSTHVAGLVRWWKRWLEESRNTQGIVHDHRKWYLGFHNSPCFIPACRAVDAHRAKNFKALRLSRSASFFPALESVSEPLKLSFSSAPQPAGTARESFPSSCERCA